MKNIQANLSRVITILILACLTACSPTTAAIPTIAPLDIDRSVAVNVEMRSYFLHLPPNLTGRQPVPIVIVFHGYQEDGKYARYYTGFDPIADANGFIVAYPRGLSWNAGTCCGYAQANKTDEAAFVRAIVADVETLVNIDPRRIYVTGFSNGALLSYRLACEMSDMIAAAAPVDGALTFTPCEPGQPVSIIHVHGAKDEVFPLEGGGVGVQFPPVEDGLTTWARLDNCKGEKAVEKEGVLAHTTYGICDPGISVELYVVDGIGHTWTPPDIAPISQIIWDFFAAHPKYR